MRFYILESGSKGNCTIVESNGKYIMIDDGLSKKKLKSKLEEINVNLEDIGALLVTHNHSDHISGIGAIAKDITFSTLMCGIDTPVNNALIPFEQYEINGFNITPLPTSHDAPGSLGFIIKADNEELVYVTDTGYVYERVCEMIVNKDYYVFESNHNVRMLLETNRPQPLKKRILGDTGHLSNEDSANYICDVIGPNTKQIILAHLSEEANTPEQALSDYVKVFEDRGFAFEDYDIRCASQVNTITGGNFEVVYNG